MCSKLFRSNEMLNNVITSFSDFIKTKKPAGIIDNNVYIGNTTDITADFINIELDSDTTNNAFSQQRDGNIRSTSVTVTYSVAGTDAQYLTFINAAEVLSKDIAQANIDNEKVVGVQNVETRFNIVKGAKPRHQATIIGDIIWQR